MTLKSKDGNPLYHRCEGEGSVAVLLHGWGGSSEWWAETMAELADRFRLVALDLPGHGRSGKERTDWTVEAYVDDVCRLFDGLGIAEAALVGHSMSAKTAVAVAAAMPGRVTKVVPIDDLLDLAYVPNPAEDAAFFAELRADYPSAIDKLVRSNLHTDAAPELIQRLCDTFVANDPAIMVPILETNSHFAVGEVLAKVQVPIRAVNGDVWPTRYDANRSLVPTFSAQVLEHTGHWPMLERPWAFAQALAEVLAS